MNGKKLVNYEIQFTKKNTIQIRHDGKSQCIQRPQGSSGISQPTGPVVLRKCAIEPYPQQSFILNKKGKFLLTPYLKRLYIFEFIR